jgi:hypothetical protein
VVIPAAHTLTAVEGKAASCTEDGVVAHNHCSVCEKNFDAEGNELDTVAIPAAHTPENVAGKAATCTEDGLTDGVKCSVCEEFITAQTVIPATNHANKTDKAYIAPTTAEDGWKAHTVCPDCGKVWDAKGEELEAVPTIEKIVPTTNYFWGVEELKDKTTGTAPSKTIVSDDRSYVRFERTGAGSDGSLYFIDLPELTDKVSGQYFIIKYRTNETISEGFGKTVDGKLGGGDWMSVNLKSDEKWHIAILDLSKGGNVIAVDGQYYIRVFRKRNYGNRRTGQSFRRWNCKRFTYFSRR